jgi:glycosyltransferase involved in cell wall biosynthesis
VSVVIPTIRGGRLLREAVGSVLAQGVESLEIVVVLNREGVDLSMLPETARLVVVREPVPVKAIALNRGLLTARGRWVAFLDDDDVWFDGKLEKQLHAMSGWSGSPACTTNFAVIDETSSIVDLGHNAPVTYRSLLQGKIEFLFSSLLVDRELMLQRGLVNGSYTRADDYECLLRIARAGPLAYVPEPLVGYRKHGGNTSNADYERFRLEALRALADSRRLARIDTDWASMATSLRGTLSMRRFWAWSTLGQAHEAFKRGDTRQAAAHLALAVRSFPPVVLERLLGPEPIRVTRKST